MKNGTKALVASLAFGLLTLHAQAGTVLIGKATNGNTVRLNDTSSARCDDMDTDSISWYYAESVMPSGYVRSRGCWHLFDDTVKIRWLTSDGEREVNWSIDLFDFTSYFNRTYGGTKTERRSTGSL